MTDPTLQTTQLQGWLGRIQAGDPNARDELVRAIQGRLEQLARRMLRRSPAVARWAETGDVFQGAVMRLLRALETVSPASTRDFLNLAAAIVRRELIDLARHFHGRAGSVSDRSRPSGPRRLRPPRTPTRPTSNAGPPCTRPWSTSQLSCARCSA